MRIRAAIVVLLSLFLLGAGPAARAQKALSPIKVGAFRKLAPAAQERLLRRLVKAAAPTAKKGAEAAVAAGKRGALVRSRYKTFREGELGTRELVSGSAHDGLLGLLGRAGVVLDWELMRRYQATTPPPPAELSAGVEKVRAHAQVGGGEHPVTSNVSEQPQIIVDEKASSAGARVIDYEATINKNALAVRAVVDAGANVVKVGSQGLSLYEMYRIYRGLPRALFGAKSPRAGKGQPLQPIAGIGLLDVTRVNDVVFRYRGKVVPLAQAANLARQGRKVAVARAPGAERMSDVDTLVGRALVAEQTGDAETARRLRDQANALTRQDAFRKVQTELVVAHLAGLRIFLIDTQHNDRGFARFQELFSDQELVSLADQAHELGMDIWAAGSINADGHGRLVKAGWNLVCFGGAARSDSGLRPESGGDFVGIDPAKIDRLLAARKAAEKTAEGSLARRKMELLAVYHGSGPRDVRERAWQDYSTLKGAKP